MMFGTTETESTWSGYIPPENLSEPELRTRVKRSTRASDPEVEQLIAIYRKGRPGISNADVDLIINTDMSGFRSGVITQLERKAEMSKAAAYSYYFTWKTPVRGGVLKSIHTLDIPFVFDTVDVTQSMTGFGQDRYALADKMRSAFAAFARTGNPGTKGPNWPAFTLAQRATMIFGSETKAVNDPYGEERKALAALRRPS
jgi:para-nitrobenzyl esterase